MVRVAAIAEGVSFAIACDAGMGSSAMGIAGKGEEHLEVLANICRILEDEEVLEKMKTTSDLDWVLSVLS